MADRIDVTDYLVNDIKKLERLRKSLGIKSWVDFAIKIDCSPSNLHDHIYTSSKDSNGNILKKPVYEKLLQPWHVKLFTLINYLNKQKSTADKNMLKMVLTPVNPPKKIPSGCNVDTNISFEDQYSNVISTGVDLKSLIPLVSDAYGVEDGVMKKGARKLGAEHQTREEVQPLSFMMANLTGIAIRTYDSYLKSKPTIKKGENGEEDKVSPPKPMRSIISKIYTIVNLLLEEGRTDLVNILLDVNETHMVEYGIKRTRTTEK